MYFAGSSINLVTMMGLIICAGMLVDNAVVVVENIDRLRREGREVKVAALAGSSEIALALTMATVTTVIVFLPMIIMSEEGMMRFMLEKLALPVVVSIIASLFVALLFLPLAASVLLRSEADRSEKGPGFITRITNRLYGWIMDPLHNLYVRSLGFMMRFRGAVLVLVVLTMVVSIWPFKQVEVSIQGRHQRGGREARFWFNLPNSYGMEQADDWFREVETVFEAKRDELGIGHLQTRFWRNRGMVKVMLKDVSETDVTVEEAIAGLKEVAPTAPGVQMFVNWQRGSGDDASLNVTLYGEDTPTLADLAEEAERRLRTLPGLTSVEPDLEAAQEELRIRIDRDRALQYGVRPEVISGTIVSALRGQRLPRYRTGEKEIEMWVQYSEADRRGVGNLSALEIPSTSGKRIPLDAVADLSIVRGFGDIRRSDRRTSLNIKLNTTWSSVGGLRGQVTEVMGGMDLPRGYSWDFGAARRWERQDNRNMLFGLLVSMVFIYLIMGFLFESALLPLSVMPSILLSWIGVFWLLWATGSKLDMMAAIGLILLAGVVVNNGIVLVDLINRLRRQGMPRSEAILEAGRLRFRPILMTALTTIMGMLPMALGKANFVGIPYSGLGRTFVGGLLSSTTLTLIVVPLFYILLDDAGVQLRLLWSGRGGRRQAEDQELADVGAVQARSGR
jgi:HAE1 family hydrophobic/amphiphilic exporter-1